MDAKIVDTLNSLAAKGRGILTPDAVVEEAKRKSSPLHAYFAARGCWDPKKAQEQWCINVARELIRTVKVEVTNTTFSVRTPAFIRDPSQAPRQGYASLSRLQSDEDLARRVVVEEFARAGAALARARAVATALGLSEEIDELKVRLDALSERVPDSAERSR